MDSSFDSIPEEFVDALVNEFAYDPIRLPLIEDRAQSLYNRRTLEKIWDSKQIPTNPYTRQPFDINNVIPQIHLKQQMREYIVKNNRSALEVIPADYTEVLNSTDMKHLLNELVVAGKHCLLAGQSSDNKELEATWKVMWQKLNLLRLYCQYTAANRETFVSIKGYEYLLNVINPRLHLLSLYYSSSIKDTEEACKEVAKIVDVVGLKDNNLQTVPLKNIWALLRILADLVNGQELKIQNMVLRIYRRMCDHCIEYVVGRCAEIFCSLSFYLAEYLLRRRHNSTDISNEDLYNVTALLKASSTRSRGMNVQRYVDGLVKVVIICISRFQDLHAACSHRAQAQGEVNFVVDRNEEQNDEEEEKNIQMISRALDRGLFLIDGIVTNDEETDPVVLFWKQRVQSLDIVKDIVRMVEHVLDGCKFFESSHLLYGLNTTASLCREEGSVSVITRNKVVQVLGEFLGSDFVKKYDTQIKWLLQDIVRSASIHSTS